MPETYESVLAGRDAAEAHIQELERRLAALAGIKDRAEALEEMVEVAYKTLGYFDSDDKIARDMKRTISEQAQARAENAKEAQCQEDSSERRMP